MTRKKIALKKNNNKQFANTHRSGRDGISKFILMLQKGVYPYEYTKDWEKFNAKFLPTKETFYSNLNMESITDLDNRQRRLDRL